MGSRESPASPPEAQPPRVAIKLLEFVFELLRLRGADPQVLASDLCSFAGSDSTPAWVSWSDYMTMIDRLGQLAGGAPGIAAVMRAARPTAYTELRAIAGFFSGPVEAFSFVTHHLMTELVPCVDGRVEVLSERRVRVRYRIADSLEGSMLYFQGTATLLEIFPTHFDLPEALVSTVSMTNRTCELVAEFPEQKPRAAWGRHLTDAPAQPTGALTRREQEVLRLACNGLTNAEIATALGVAASTVKTQLSSILAKMNVANRTELAARYSPAR